MDAFVPFPEPVPLPNLVDKVGLIANPGNVDLQVNNVVFLTQDKLSYDNNTPIL